MLHKSLFPRRIGIPHSYPSPNKSKSSLLRIEKSIFFFCFFPFPMRNMYCTKQRNSELLEKLEQFSSFSQPVALSNTWLDIALGLWIGI